MFKKVLIANRGEIAVRIIRTCRDLGIGTVAVFSDADRASRHVRMADESYHLGGSAPQESYLNVGRIVEAAVATGSEALHPGYGFLSENPALAEACEGKGVVFVGPSPATLRRIGEKTSARAVARAAGVPIVPGTIGGAESMDELRQAAERIGYPVMLKACSGGGGKGMRRVNSTAEIADAYRAAASEARTSFGDGCVYVEKLIERPRHVEVQLLADSHGNVLCLGERECSVQRRHQKLIEETPSPAVDPGLRERLFEAATRAAQAVSYVNAGTAEFLLDGNGDFYFLEMNARLQVEHPVTEEATGIDLVREQLRVAAGAKLDAGVLTSRMLNRAAIECRIYAEDPYNGFLPSVGIVALLQQPSGPGVRVESASYPGMQVGLHYDPLLAKLVTWGDTRAEAIGRMRRALREYTVLGVKTTIPFHRFAMDNEAFVAGEYDTGFAELWHEEAPTNENLVPVAAIAAALVESRYPRKSLAPAGTSSTSAWGVAARRESMRPR